MWPHIPGKETGPCAQDAHGPRMVNASVAKAVWPSIALMKDPQFGSFGVEILCRMCFEVGIQLSYRLTGPPRFLRSPGGRLKSSFAAICGKDPKGIEHHS